MQLHRNVNVTALRCHCHRKDLLAVISVITETAAAMSRARDHQSYCIRCAFYSQAHDCVSHSALGCGSVTALLLPLNGKNCAATY